MNWIPMVYVSNNYKNNSDAPIGKWVCAPNSGIAPYTTAPPDETRHNPTDCGQCVSYVRAVCPTLKFAKDWIKGPLVKGNKDIEEGTVIATFDISGHYKGHAAIYVNQDDKGIQVYDQWVTGAHPKAIGPRTIRWDGDGISNNGDSFHVVK